MFPILRTTTRFTPNALWPALVASYRATVYIRSPERRAFLCQDGSIGLVAATPLGAISVGGAVGDAGHRKFFFTLGRLF